MADNVKYQCSSCGIEAKAGSKFCTQCGSPVITVPIEEPAEEPIVAPATELVAEEKASEPTEEAPVTEEAPAEETLAEEALAEEAPVEEAPAVDNAAFYYQNPQTEEEPPKKENFFKKHLKLICIIGIALVAVIAIIIAIIFLFGGSSKYVEATNDITLMYMSDDKQTVIIDKNGVNEVKIKGNYNKYISSMDGESLLIYMANDTLYLYNDGALVKIAKDVSGEAQLAANGDGVVYVDADGNLALYSVSSGTSAVVSDDYAKQYCVSPDGESVLYATKDKFEVMLYEDGESRELGVEAIPVGVSDGADLIYYIKNIEDDEILCVVKGGQEVELSETEYVCYNADLTQVIFSNANKTYVSVNGGEKKKMSSGEVDLDALTIYGGVVELWSDKVVIVPINDFGGMYFMNKTHELVYADADFDFAVVEKNVKSFKAAKTSNAVYYLKENGELYRGEAYNAFSCIAENVDSYEITSDGSACYILDDKTLSYIDGVAKAVEIEDKVVSANITYDDYLLFICEDKTLYATCDGGEKVTVNDEGETIVVLPTPIATYYFTGEAGKMTLYGALDGVEFTPFVEDINNADLLSLLKGIIL